MESLMFVWATTRPKEKDRIPAASRAQVTEQIIKKGVWKVKKVKKGNVNPTSRKREKNENFGRKRKPMMKVRAEDQSTNGEVKKLKKKVIGSLCVVIYDWVYIVEAAS
jgi:hypothetical protein